MEFESFQALVRDFCRVAALLDPEALLNRRWMEIDGQALAFAYDADDNAQLRIYVDLGVFEPSLKVLHKLLEQNYTDGSIGRWAFGIDPSDGHVMLIAQLALENNMDGAAFDSALRGIAAVARMQRESAFAVLDVRDVAYAAARV